MANTTYPDPHFTEDTRSREPEKINVVASVTQEEVEKESANLDDIHETLLLILQQLRYITGEDE
jgi:hypothetical protein